MTTETENPEFWPWWTESELFSLSNGRSHAEDGLEVLYETFWKPVELAAWAYELVRHLPVTDETLAPADEAFIKGWPPFPKLSDPLRRILQSAMDHHLARRPTVRVVAENGRVVERGFSQPISIDLLARPETQARVFEKWIAAECIRHGIDLEQVRKSHQQDQRHKLGNWQMIWLLSHRRERRAFPLSATERSNRRNAIRYAKGFAPIIIAGMRLGTECVLENIEIPSLPPLDFRLAGRQFSIDQITTAIRQASKRSSHKGSP